MRIELRKGNSALTDRNTCSQRTTDRTRCTAERSDSTAECGGRSEEHTSELQSRLHLVCRLLLEKKNILVYRHHHHVYPAPSLRLSNQKTSGLTNHAWPPPLPRHRPPSARPSASLDNTRRRCGDL